MKRMHIHIGVRDLEHSIRFYTALFGQPPGKQEGDYARWMLEDPSLNFAISSRTARTGVNHLGLQVDTDDELAELRSLAGAADARAVLDEGETTCCYARSDKHWTVDPQGVAWEHFRTLEDAVEFGRPAPAAVACCGGS